MQAERALDLQKPHAARSTLRLHVRLLARDPRPDSVQELVDSHPELTMLPAALSAYLSGLLHRAILEADAADELYRGRVSITPCQYWIWQGSSTAGHCGRANMRRDVGFGSLPAMPAGISTQL